MEDTKKDTVGIDKKEFELGRRKRRDEVAEIRRDIGALEKEINKFEEEEQELKNNIEKLEKELRENKKDDTKKKPKEELPDEKDEYEEPFVKHNFFDESISKFFYTDMEAVLQEGSQEYSENKRQKMAEVSGNIISRRKRYIEVKDNITLENIFRFGGVTAFPINKLANEMDDEIVGLRFDIFSHRKLCFSVPHYVILRRESLTEKGAHVRTKWTVHKHTLPAYIPLEEHRRSLDNDNEKEGIRDFGLKIREFFMKTQYKHDKFDSLLEIKFAHLRKDKVKADVPVIAKLEKDLQCKKVLLFLESGNKEPKKEATKLSIVCNNEGIETADFITCSINEERKLLYESMLRNCDMASLIRTFKYIFSQLDDE